MTDVLVAVVVSFFICWTPFHAQRLIATYADQTAAMILLFTVLTYISGVTYYLSATVNPILYQVMSLKFRQAFVDTFGCCCPEEARSKANAGLDLRQLLQPQLGRLGPLVLADTPTA
ncbi:hypothetical protein MTO96_047989 [Rhipicephalus appendiculatus]